MQNDRTVLPPASESNCFPAKGLPRPAPQLQISACEKRAYRFPCLPSSPILLVFHCVPRVHPHQFSALLQRTCGLSKRGDEDRLLSGTRRKEEINDIIVEER